MTKNNSTILKPVYFNQLHAIMSSQLICFQKMRPDINIFQYSKRIMRMAILLIVLIVSCLSPYDNINQYRN